MVFCRLRSLARKAGENRQTACDQKELTSDSICTEVDFAQVLKRSPSGNQWCVEYEKKKRAATNETQEENDVCPKGAARNMRDHINLRFIVSILSIAFITITLW